MHHDHIVPFFGTTTHINAPAYLPVSFVSLWMPYGTLSSYLKSDNVKIDSVKRPLTLEEKYGLVSGIPNPADPYLINSS